MRLIAAVSEELGDLDGVPVGIGPVVAGVNAARLLASEPPSAVLLIGTCGAYPGRGSIGDVIVGTRIGFASGVASIGLGYTPRPPAPVTCDGSLSAGVEARRAAVLTCPAVSTDPGLVERLGDGWDVEHLEAFGVAFACHQAGVPFAVVLGVANIVGPDAHVEWLTHREAAQEAARQTARELLAYLILYHIIIKMFFISLLNLKCYKLKRML